jgi:cell division protein FtsW (lipid II flippase)
MTWTSMAGGFLAVWFIFLAFYPEPYHADTWRIILVAAMCSLAAIKYLVFPEMRKNPKMWININCGLGTAGVLSVLLVMRFMGKY